MFSLMTNNNNLKFVLEIRKKKKTLIEILCIYTNKKGPKTQNKLKQIVIKNHERYCN